MKLELLKSVESAHRDPIWCSTWVPASDSRPHPLLLTGSEDHTVTLWRCNDNDNNDVVLQRNDYEQTLGVVSVAAHPSGAIAASSSLDSAVRIFNVDNEDTIALFEVGSAENWHLRFHPKGTFLAVAGGNTTSIKLYDTATWQLVTSLKVPCPKSSEPIVKGAVTKKFVLSVAWSPDGTRLACGSIDGTISVFDVARSKFLHHLEGHVMPIRSLTYSPVDLRVLFSGSNDSNINMYDAEGKSLVGSMSGHSGWVLSMDVSPDGAAVASCSSDKTVKLWDLSQRAAVQTMTNHTDMVWGVAFRPPGGTGVRAVRLASVSDDKSISLYDYS